MSLAWAALPGFVIGFWIGASVLSEPSPKPTPTRGPPRIERGEALARLGR